MQRQILNLSYLLALLFTSTHLAAQNSENIGGDTYLSDASPSATENAERDLFISGFSVSIEADVYSDAHAAGFNVDVEESVGGDLYAAASNLSIEGAIGEDLTAAAFNIELEDSASVAGNARIAAGTISIDAPITGSLVAAAGTVRLNETIGGDVRLTASEITFGPNAELLGKLSYSAPDELDIPTSVISEDRVSYMPSDEFWAERGIGDSIGESAVSIWLSLFGTLFVFISTLLFLWLIAAIVLLLLPDKVESGRKAIVEAPWKMLLLGFLSLSLLCGLVPAAAVTLVGIPLIPIVILIIFVACLLGFLLGVFTLSWQLISKIRPLPETISIKLGVTAVGLLVVITLGGIPILGWLFKVLITLTGLGAIVAPAIDRWFKQERVSNDSATEKATHG